MPQINKETKSSQHDRVGLGNSSIWPIMLKPSPDIDFNWIPNIQRAFSITQAWYCSKIMKPLFQRQSVVKPFYGYIEPPKLLSPIFGGFTRPTKRCATCHVPIGRESAMYPCVECNNGMENLAIWVPFAGILNLTAIVCCFALFA